MTRIAYRREVDGLRAIAVLAVVLYHASALPSAGFAGVDIFFAISGYLITLILLREHDDSGRIDLLAFYARRVRRILPALTLLVLTVLGLASLLLPPSALIHAAHSASSAMAFAANIFFEATSGGYFDRNSDQMPLLHLWSLGVEEQFYVFWPVFLMVVLRARAKWLPGIIIGFGLASLALSEFWVRADPQAAFYQMPARFWELAAGGLIASLRARPQHRLMANLGVLVVLGACCVPMSHFPGLGALPAVAGASLLILAVHGGGEMGSAGVLLRSRPVVFIGLISYSLYLWHWPLLALYRASMIGGGILSTRLLLCGLAGAIAFASYRYVEQPFRRLVATKTRVVVVGSVFAACLAIGAYGLGYRVQAEEALRPTDNPLALKAENDLPPNPLKCHYTVWEVQFPKRGCESIPGVKPTVVLWGDSMALAWQPVAWGIARKEKRSAIAYTRDSCAPIIGYLPPNPLPGHIKCRDFNDQVAGMLDGVDTVVIAARWVPAADWIGWKLLRTTLKTLSPKVHRIIVMGPSPELRDEAPKCIRANALDRCAITRIDYENDAVPIRAGLSAAANGLRNVSLVDPSDFLCTATDCPVVRGGIALYRDKFHVTYTAATEFFHEFCEPSPDAACVTKALTREGTGTTLPAHP